MGLGVSPKDFAIVMKYRSNTMGAGSVGTGE